MNLLKIYYISFLIILVLFNSANALTIDSCQSLSSGTSYLLNASLSYNTSGSCLGAYGSGVTNVTIDCDGYTIYGNDTVYSTGIGFENSNDIIVKNCLIHDFEDSAIFTSDNVTNMRIENVTAWSSSIGIHVCGSNNNGITIKDVTAHDNTKRGIVLSSVQNGIVHNVNIYNHNQHGIIVQEESNNITLSYIRTNNNSECGICCYNSDYVNIYHSTSYEDANGIEYRDCNNMIAYNNTIVPEIKCIEGLRTCADNIVRKCVDNEWKDVEICQWGCEDGACNPKPEEVIREGETGGLVELITGSHVAFWGIIIIILLILGGAYWKLRK